MMTLRSFVPLAALASALLLSTPARADVAPDPPSVTITSPTDGATFDGPTATFDVTLDVMEGFENEDASGVALQVDGETVVTDMEKPFDGFEGVEVGAGMHTLVAVVTSAEDGVEYPSPEVNIVVFDASGETGTDSGTDTTDGGTIGSTDSDDDNGDDGGKCAVVDTSRLGGSGVMVILGLLCLGMARRRREAVSA